MVPAHFFLRFPWGIGDPDFDAEVQVAAKDEAVALACLSPAAREVVRSGVREGWVREGATWRWEGLGSVAEVVESAIRRGARLCSALAWS